jgi:hypothetical protein
VPGTLDKYKKDDILYYEKRIELPEKAKPE